MMRKHKLPSAEEIHALLDYNPETGVFTWKVTKSGWVVKGRTVGSKNNNGYLRVGIGRRHYFLSRIAFFLCTGQSPEEVDHINGDRTDNRACNLRAASRHENCLNKSVRSDSRTGVKGVSWRPDVKKWSARSTDSSGKRVFLGYYRTISDAVAVLNDFRREQHGEFAKN
ncbi:hypothetical protein L420_03771 [Enterobacter hormaechei subsp. hoffmannii UCICRE 9]|uniref:HNH endonuclease n=1 Tax=Enterobacter hormaechei TaxID=158836 RepID=UPI0003BE315B|nr:HNH endonuclease [Enterobacter hormaechei]ESL86576.1 hypothetical protein L420_03771 [Enterobacter hormaechei subsp. hoffmannii UCICRE 9]